MVKQQILMLILSSFIFSMGYSREASPVKARVSEVNNVAVGHRQLQGLIETIHFKTQMYLSDKEKYNLYFKTNEMKNYRKQIGRIKDYIEKIPSVETSSKLNSVQEGAEKQRKTLRDAVLLLEKRFSDFDDQGYSKATKKHISYYGWGDWNNEILTLSVSKVTGVPRTKTNELLSLICEDPSHWNEFSFKDYLEKIKKQFEEWELILNTTEEQQKLVSDFQFIKEHTGSYDKRLIEEKNKKCDDLGDSYRKSSSQLKKFPSQSKPPPQ